MESFKLDAGMLAAILSLIATVVINGFQFLNQRSQGKKAETEASGILIEMALKLNKQEMDTMREVIKSLKDELKEKEMKIDFLEMEIIDLKRALAELKKEQK